MTAERKLRFLRLPDVIEKTGLQQTALYELEMAGKFPKRIKITERATGWLEHEVNQWCDKRVIDNRGHSALA